jgi:hypothetical protein
MAGIESSFLVGDKIVPCTSPKYGNAAHCKSCFLEYTGGGRHGLGPSGGYPHWMINKLLIRGGSDWAASPTPASHWTAEACHAKLHGVSTTSAH